MVKRKGIFICLISLLAAVSCAVNPVTGKHELSFYSEQDEIALGRETDAQIKQQYGIYQDAALNQYVENIGRSLAPHTHRPHLAYHFAVLDSPVVNAFAAPGGYVYVTRGLLGMMNSEAELAAVLGHELGHVNARHSIRRMSERMLTQIGLAVGSALNETFADLAGAAGLGAQLLFLKYSRDDEREADQLGVEYARKGKYNPGEMISFFTSLQKMGDLSGGQSLPGFLSTHPLTSERIQNTGDMILAGDEKLQVKSKTYLRQIDGTVYGEDPRQGFVEGKAFYHPEMRFFFIVPEEWQLQNSPSKVILAPEGGDAGVILQAEKSTDTPRAFGQERADRLEGRRFINEKETSVNGLKAYHQLCDLDRENSKNIRLRLSFIKYTSHIFTFMAFSTTDRFSIFEDGFDRIVGSFNKLRDKSYLNRKPKRLKLTQADGRRTLQEVFQRMGMEKRIWAKFAVMNGMELNQKPPEGKLIKIVR